MIIQWKHRPIINKVRTFEWLVTFIVRQSSYSLGSLGALKEPSPLKSPQGLLMEVTTAYAVDWPRDNGSKCHVIIYYILCLWFCDMFIYNCNFMNMYMFYALCRQLRCKSSHVYKNIFCVTNITEYVNTLNEVIFHENSETLLMSS